MYTVLIDSYETIEEKVHYTIIISSNSGNKMISKRYSDLKSLHEQISQKNIDFKLHLSIPHFPGRKIFRRTNHSIEGILARGKELQNYLQEIINLKELQSFKILRDLLPYVDQQQETTKILNNNELDKDLCWLQMDELKRSYLEKHEILINENSKDKTNQSFNNYNYLQRYHFSFDDYLLMSDHVVYIITMTDTKKTTKYQYKIRYSDLRDYHKLLKKIHFKMSLTKFPKRKFIGQTIDNPIEIQERQEQLEQYLNNIFRIKEFVMSEPLQYFITKVKLEGKPIIQSGLKKPQAIRSMLYDSNEDVNNRRQSI